MVDTSSNNVTRLGKKLRAQLQPNGSILCLQPEARELLLEIKNVLWALLAERNKSEKHVVLAPGWLGVDLDKAEARSQEILNERFLAQPASHSDKMNDAVEAGLIVEATVQLPKDPTAWSTTSACLAALQKTLQILQDSETSNAKSMTQGTPNQQFAQGAALILQQTKAALTQLEKERDDAIKANDLNVQTATRLLAGLESATAARSAAEAATQEAGRRFASLSMMKSGVEAERDALRAWSARLRKAVIKAAKQFEAYEAQHRAKGTTTAFLKAETNQALKLEMQAALCRAMTDIKIVQRNARNAIAKDSRWEGYAEALQPRVDAITAALSASLPPPRSWRARWCALHNLTNAARCALNDPADEHGTRDVLAEARDAAEQVLAAWPEPPAPPSVEPVPTTPAP